MDLLLRVVVVELPQVGDERPGQKQDGMSRGAEPGGGAGRRRRAVGYSRGQRQLLDVVDPDQLSDAEAAKVLQRLDAAEAGHRVQELHRRGRQT